MNNFYNSPINKDEHRAAPRHKISLKSSVLITAIRQSADGQESYFFLNGQLLDFSLTGLALIISRADMQELNRFGNDLALRLLLPLPAEAIQLEAALVRFQPLDEREDGQVLVGTHITDMNGRDRILFMDFIAENEVLQAS